MCVATAAHFSARTSSFAAAAGAALSFPTTDRAAAAAATVALLLHAHPTDGVLSFSREGTEREEERKKERHEERRVVLSFFRKKSAATAAAELQQFLFSFPSFPATPTTGKKKEARKLRGEERRRGEGRRAFFTGETNCGERATVMSRSSESAVREKIEKETEEE